MEKPEAPAFLSKQVNRGFYLIPEGGESPREELKVVCAGWEDCSAEYRIDRTDFPCLALEYVASGDWELTTPQGKCRIGPGAVFSYGPGLSYSLRPLCKSGLSKYFVDFSGSSALELLRCTGLEPGRYGMVAQHRWLRELFDQLVEIRFLDVASRSQLARMTLELILVRLPVSLGGDVQITQARKSFERCRNYLSENYLQLTSLSSAAEACGVSPAYLSRLFARFASESPKAFLDRLKMDHAAQLLLQNNIPVKQAAAEIGYADVFHFSRVFRKCFGVSPGHFCIKK
jgi:AraC-like DNA-binding protein